MTPRSQATVTFLFTDIEGSTRLWDRHPDLARIALIRHDRLIEQLVAEHDGVVVRPRGEGDSRFAVFADAACAVSAACAIQRAFLAEPWPTPEPLRARIALHTGSAELRDGDFYGSDVNRCARLRAVAHAGQTVLSGRTADDASAALPEDTSLRGLGVHRLKDLGQPERIYQLLYPGLPADFPPLRSLTSLLNNLPVQLTSFVGRERELAEVCGIVRNTRLVTIAGAGGVGKTRLSLHVAADLLDVFDDGVWFVELASLTDASQVIQSLASVLGIREQPGQLPLDTVIQVLRPKHAMLVLDNCEHLVDACAQLVNAILSACAHIHVVATSREALGLTGETTWRVPSLSLPEEMGRPQTLEVLERAEAVRLFLDRASAVRPGFTLTEQNAPAVVEVCRQLDGIPLALELAAAQIHVLTPQQIAAGLADRFHMLSRGSRVAPTRQQTLRALVDWSYNLLSSLERVLLARLGVFADGLDLQAAQAVCAGDDIQPPSMLGLLSRLVDKSLVVAEPPSSGPMRYRLLETLRHYALERLTEIGGGDKVKEAHAAHYLWLAESAEPHLQGAQQLIWLERLEREHANLRAARHVFQEFSDSGAQARLVSALWRFWVSHGHLSEGRESIERALHESRDLPPGVRARVLAAAGVLAREQGEYASASTYLQQSLALSRETGATAGIAFALNGLANVAWAQGEYQCARQWYEESLELRRTLGDPASIAMCLNNLGTLASDQGDYALAWARHEESMALRRALGDQRGIAQSLQNLGEVSLRRGDVCGAAALYRESLLLFRELGERVYITRNLDALARVAEATHQYDRAARLFGAAAGVRDAIRTPLGLTDHSAYEPSLASVRTQLGEAAFAANWAEGMQLPLNKAIEEALVECS